MKRVLVINYHRIDTGAATETSQLEQLYTVRRDSLVTQLELLAKKQIPLIPLSSLVSNTVRDDFSVSITVDDGNESDYSVVLPLVRKYNIPVTFFLSLTGKNVSHLIREQIIELSGNENIVIGSHSVNHKDMTRLSRKEQEYELQYSKQFLESLTGKPVNFFALPYGMYNRQVLRLSIEAGYKAIMTSNIRMNDPRSCPLLIHRWSVRSDTSLRRFEKMITLGSVEFKLNSVMSGFRYAATRIVGKGLADRFNLLLRQKAGKKN